eukprot:257903_1
MFNGIFYGTFQSDIYFIFILRAVTLMLTLQKNMWTKNNLLKGHNVYKYFVVFSRISIYNPMCIHFIISFNHIRILNRFPQIHIQCTAIYFIKLCDEIFHQPLE